ncbi:MAG: S46 family peptidase, partial [Prevotellaceae bacterium]|nr:S46 family peptidase [Prevotellaceae bacterium]
MKRINLFLAFMLLFSGIKADEGMWMLPLIEKLNIQKMQGMGLSLSAGEIYDSQGTSLKDAVVIFGNGCTGVMVSEQGLVFTNHHCGYSSIQQLSSVEHNYLRDGFTAEQLTDEISVPDLNVTFLLRMEDVTGRILSQLPDSLTGQNRKIKQDSICSAISKEASDSTHYTARVESFFSDNEFYLFVYEKFTDIRFAYAPPSSIGKFGGDADNWMWPRHTGDFAVFRVYCSPDGKPADYSEENIPYSPKRFAAISTEGYRPGDYAMILGNPGSTNRYLSSWGVTDMMKTGNQARIDVRGVKQEIWQSYMRADEAVNIAYADKYAGSSNYWKNSVGMNRTIAKLDIINRKKKEENEFRVWTEASEERTLKYGNVLQTLDDAYSKMYPYSRTAAYFYESLLSSVELPHIAARVVSLMEPGQNIDSVIAQSRSYYDDYYPEVDKATMAAMLEVYRKSVDADALPDFYESIQKKFKNDYSMYVEQLFEKSIFTTHEKLSKALKKRKHNISKDPAMLYWASIRSTMKDIYSGEYEQLIEQIKHAERLHEAGLKEMAQEKGKALYPDANFTMRLTYGKIGAYQPADAVNYDYYTTPNGILEKEIPGDKEFDVPARLKEAIANKEYLHYADRQTGEMHVNFLSSNDITGGNSGRPGFKAAGEWIGLAVDGT